LALDAVVDLILHQGLEESDVRHTDFLEDHFFEPPRKGKGGAQWGRDNWDVPFVKSQFAQSAGKRGTINILRKIVN
jgi:hypothetical protein